MGDTLESQGQGPRITHAWLIDDRRIELYWSDQVFRADDERNFRETLDGRELALVHWRRDMPWDAGCVYQKETGCTTLALVEPVDVESAERMAVEVTGEVRDYLDQPAAYGVAVPLEYRPHYTSFLATRDGIRVKGSKVVQAYSLDLAGKIIDVMLEKIPQVAEKLVERGVEVAVYGLKYDAYDVPEHRMGYVLASRPVEGFGADAEIPVTSVSEANLIRLRSGRYATRYPNEMVLVHEFAHAIHLAGINFLDDRTLADRVRATYEHACEHGLWPSSYAISNYEEYFATLSTVWFNVMEEGIDGKWDGIRGPVNTREELAEYDPDAYALMAAVYPEKSLPYPWRFTKDDFDVHGRPRVYNLGTTFDWEFIR